ncbi:DUF2513 domain-containing protein [Methanogenium cariaci]|jgi:uncharacterized protein DUF2513|uniref:DUF2513 domain-containing protein n=1 Tax=Methanogenium cariaci TaxID=2197 RepID=UPI000785B215|nr:DUF2513 domain-containing protein [Methanogenium cariaci]
MQRNYDLIREILLEIESRRDLPFTQLYLQDDSNKDEVSYQVKIMADEGLIDASCDRTYGPSYTYIYVIKDLTPKGHDFIDNCRDDGIWKKVKAELGNKISSVPFDIITALLIKYAMGV